MTNSKIERFEWDFDSCPADQLELCFEYERARNSPEQQEIKEAESWRRMWPGKTFDDYWKHVVAGNAHYALFPYPEFPLTPYLAIPEPERCRRFALIKAFGLEPVCAEDGQLSKEFREKHGSEDRSWFEEAVHTLNREFDLSESYKGVSHHGADYQIEGNAIKCADMGATFAVFRFQWGMCSDEAFIDALRAWLDKNRAKPVNKDMDNRGGGSPTRKFRSKLNQLGAWRLLNFPMTWEEAANHTQAVREDHKSLYSEQPAWIRARNEADRFLGMSNR